MAASVAVRLPAWLNSGSVSYPAENDRLTEAAMSSPSGTALSPRTGILPYTSTAGVNQGFKVAQTGSPSMAVTVDIGQAMIDGTLTASQGGYVVTNDAVQTLTVTASHATLARIDIVCITVEDSQYAGSNNDALVQVVTGTPASSPAAPATPANSLVIAKLAIAASSTSVVNGNITDSRLYTAGAGGVIPCLSSALPSSPYVGMIAFETDTNRLRVFRNDGKWGIGTAVHGAWKTSSAISLTTGTYSNVSTATVVSDAAGFSAVGGSFLTIPTGLGGLYVVTFRGTLNVAPATGDYTQLDINGGSFGGTTHYASTFTSDSLATVTVLTTLADGDHITPNAFQSTGSTRTVTATLELARIGDLS